MLNNGTLARILLGRSWSPKPPVNSMGATVEVVQAIRISRNRPPDDGRPPHSNRRGQKPTESPKRDWSLLSPQGAALFYVALNPGCTRREVAEALELTERTIWSLIRDLSRAGAVRSQNEGRRHRFFVNLGAPLQHPVLKGIKVRTILGGLAREPGR